MAEIQPTFFSPNRCSILHQILVQTVELTYVASNQDIFAFELLPDHLRNVCPPLLPLWST